MNQTQLHQSKATFRLANAYEKFKRFYNLENSDKKLNILDVGCGAAIMDKHLQALGHSVIGIDTFVADDELHDFIKCDINFSWPVPDKEFDYVICLDTLEHLFDPIHVLNEARRVLKSDGQGKFIIGVPNAFDLRQRFHMMFGGGIVHWDHIKDGEPVWRYPHIRFFDLKSLLRMLSEEKWYPEFIQFNFQAGGIIPVRFTPAILRSILLKKWPALFSGKFIFGLSTLPVKPKYLYLDSTPVGL